MSDIPSRPSDAGPEPGPEMTWRDDLEEARDILQQAGRCQDWGAAVRFIQAATGWCASAEEKLVEKQKDLRGGNG